MLIFRPNSAFNRPNSACPNSAFNRPNSACPNSAFNRPNSACPNSSFNRPNSAFKDTFRSRNSAAVGLVLQWVRNEKETQTLSTQLPRTNFAAETQSKLSCCWSCSSMGAKRKTNSDEEDGALISRSRSAVDECSGCGS